MRHRLPAKKFGVSLILHDVGRLHCRAAVFKTTRLLVDASNEPSAFVALGVAVRDRSSQNSVSPRLSLDDVVKDGVVLRSREDNAAAAEDGQEPDVRKLRTYRVVSRRRCCSAPRCGRCRRLDHQPAGTRRYSSPRLRCRTPAPSARCRTRIPRALSQARLCLTTAFAVSESPM